MPYLLPALLGIFSVLQAGLNERLIAKFGVTIVVVWNGLILLGVGMLIWGLARLFPEVLWSEFRVGEGVRQWAWWYVVPGALGYALVAGLPVSFQWVGAAGTMVTLIALQVVAGLIWDTVFSDLHISGVQILGAMLTILGAVLVCWYRQ